MTGRTMIRIAATVAVAAGTASAQAVGDARPISLDEAVRLAQLNQPQTVQARNTVRNAEMQVRRSWFDLGFIPTLGIGSSWSQRGGDRYAEGVKLPSTATPWSFGRNLSIGNFTLFDGGQRWNALRTSRANLDANEAAIVTARYSVALNVKTAYYAVLTAREQRAAADRQLEQARQQLAVATAKMNAGSATRTDSLSAAIAIGQARQAILNADNAVANANAQLTRYAATTFTVTAMPNDTAEVTPLGVSEAELLRLALIGPQVTQSTAQVRSAEASRRQANSRYFPTFTMGASYGWTIENSQKFQFADGPNGTSTGLNFGFNYTFWDNFQREQQRANARTTHENAEANLRDQRFLVQQNLTQQLNTFRTAMASIELNRLQIAAAEENVRVVQQQYNLGTKQVLDLLTAQTSLDNARTQLITSRQNARIAKANIESIIGRDLR
ncbi:MAG: TolC family protein [Gemmatimonadetes bacterium]|nr:TolC family protein [Gemmatimonadota bacterium]